MVSSTSNPSGYADSGSSAFAASTSYGRQSGSDAYGSLTRTAEQLHVQPNTVRYRLKRVREITRHDPFVPDELILLALGVRLQGAAPAVLA